MKNLKEVILVLNESSKDLLNQAEKAQKVLDDIKKKSTDVIFRTCGKEEYKLKYPVAVILKGDEEYIVDKIKYGANYCIFLYSGNRLEQSWRLKNEAIGLASIVSEL